MVSCDRNPNKVKRKRSVVTIDSFLTSDKRRELAENLQKCTLQSIQAGNKLRKVCSNNKHLPGGLVQIQIAANRLRKGKDVSDLLPEAVASGKAHIKLAEARKLLASDVDAEGKVIPEFLCLELSRRIFEKDKPNRKPVVLSRHLLKVLYDKDFRLRNCSSVNLNIEH